MKNILNNKEFNFNKRFIYLCEKKLENKEYNSFDFYDVFNLSYSTLDYFNWYKKYDIQINNPDEDLNIPNSPESPKFYEPDSFNI